MLRRALTRSAISTRSLSVLFDFSDTLFGRRRGGGWLGIDGVEGELVARALRHPGPLLPLTTAEERHVWDDRDLAPDNAFGAYGPDLG